MDVTFNYCDNNFSQLNTIHRFKNNIYIQSMFCFLPGKTLKKYIELAKKNIAAGIMSKKFVFDFEISMHQAFIIIFLNAQMWGCRFYLGQVWYRII